MSKVVDVGRDQQALLINELSEALVGVLEAFSSRHGISPLSATALALRCCVLGLQEFGGIPARPYSNSVVEGIFSNDEREKEAISRRGRRYFEGMADHFDLLTSNQGGRPQ